MMNRQAPIAWGEKSVAKLQGLLDAGCTQKECGEMMSRHFLRTVSQRSIGHAIERYGLRKPTIKVEKRPGTIAQAIRPEPKPVVYRWDFTGQDVEPGDTRGFYKAESIAGRMPRRED